MVGIGEEDVRAGVGPEGKAEVIRELQASGGSRRDDVERRWWKRWTFLSDQDQVQRVMFVGGQSVVVGDINSLACAVRS